MEINFEQMREQVRILFGDSKTAVHWQLYYDPKGEEQRPDLAKDFYGTIDDNLEFFKWAQTEYCGIYFCINETDTTARKETNITRCRLLFVDGDGEVEPNWPLKPHLVTRRDATHWHAFFKVSDILSNDEFRLLQKRLSTCLNSDGQVTDPSRVARISGSVHYKEKNSPAQYLVDKDYTKIIGANHQYTKQEIINAFPISAQDEALAIAWLANRDGNQLGSDEFTDEKFYVKQFTNWIKERAPVAVIGSGSMTVFKVANYARDRAISLKKCQELMWEHYNSRCEPPWADNEQRDFDDTIARGYRYATSAIGCKIAKVVFQNCDPIPEPIGGWEANAKINALKTITVEEANECLESVDRLTREAAELVLPQMDIKASHYDLARVFDGMVYDGKNIVRHEKQYYVCNGVSWKQVSDDVVKAKIMRMYSMYSPPDSFTRGVFAVHNDLVNVPDVTNGSLLSNPFKDVSSWIPYQNGLLDMNSSDKTLKPHTHDFFCLSELDYDYKPEAECPLWLKFLSEVFDEQESIDCLQEWFGYCLTNDTRLQKFMTLIGKSRAGKGVISDILKWVVGEDNCAAPTLANLTKDSTLHALSSKMVGFFPDAHSVNFNSRDAVLSNFKAVTGGDAITYHLIYKGARTTTFNIKFVLSTNNMPEFVDSSGALANRMLVLYFKKSFAGKEDVNLRDKLKKEIPGINQWAIRGLERLRANNGVFTESQSSKEEREEIREDMFPLSQFVNQFCDLLEGASTKVEELYAGYKLWATLAGIKKPMTELQFNRTLRNSELDITPYRRRINPGTNERERGFEGIQLTSDIYNKISAVSFTPVNEETKDES